MMSGHVITVRALAPEDGVIPVFWRLGRKIGKLVFDTGSPPRDLQILSELAALHHLLVVREVAGKERSGRNLEIRCSFGAIRKVAMGRSSKPQVAAWGRFLRVRFSEAVFVVDKDSSWVPVRYNGPRLERLPLRPPLEIVLTSSGPVVLTRHAVERFAQRNCIPSLDRAWRSLSTLLRESRIRRVGPRRDNAELWCFGRWRGIVVRNGTEHVLKTMIFKH